MGSYIKSRAGLWHFWAKCNNKFGCPTYI